MVDYSILDFAVIREGETVCEALQRGLQLAVQAEEWGYRRFWIAEHHNVEAVASAATALVISQVAAATKIIRVGSGGIMLPNHPPLLVAEQFGTLDALYPGRIDLGLGRSSGGNEAVEEAIARPGSRERFPQDVQELRDMLGPAKPDQPVRAIPGTGSQVPIWILGSTTNGAELAAELGLPFAFAAHFRPNNLLTALAAYRSGFKPSPQLDRPRVIVTLSAIAAETDAEARLLATSMSEFSVGTVRNAPQPLRPPRHDVEADWTEAERKRVNAIRQRAQVGSRETIRHGLQGLINETAADEIMVFSTVYDTEARLRSYKIMAEIVANLQIQTAPSSQGKPLPRQEAAVRSAPIVARFARNGENVA